MSLPPVSVMMHCTWSENSTLGIKIKDSNDSVLIDLSLENRDLNCKPKINLEYFKSLTGATASSDGDSFSTDGDHKDANIEEDVLLGKLWQSPTQPSSSDESDDNDATNRSNVNDNYHGSDQSLFSEKSDVPNRVESSIDGPIIMNPSSKLQYKDTGETVDSNSNCQNQFATNQIHSRSPSSSEDSNEISVTFEDDNQDEIHPKKVTVPLLQQNPPNPASFYDQIKSMPHSESKVYKRIHEKYRQIVMKLIKRMPKEKGKEGKKWLLAYFKNNNPENDIEILYFDSNEKALSHCHHICDFDHKEWPLVVYVKKINTDLYCILKKVDSALSKKSLEVGTKGSEHNDPCKAIFYRSVDGSVTREMNFFVDTGADCGSIGYTPDEEYFKHGVFTIDIMNGESTPMLIGSLSFDGEKFSPPTLFDIDWDRHWNAIGSENLRGYFLVWSKEEKKFEVHPFNKDIFKILCGKEWVIVKASDIKTL